MREDTDQGSRLRQPALFGGARVGGVCRAVYGAVYGAVLCVATVVAGVPLRAQGGSEVRRLLEQSVCEVYERCAPAVVVVEVDLAKEFPEPEPEAPAEPGPRRAPGGAVGTGEENRWILAQPNRSEGSGFLVRENGVILTNYHVVRKALRIGVRLRDGRRLPARLLGSDERLDVAALQVEAKSLPVLTFAESAGVRIGQWVGAIGAPFSQEWSFTSGMISGKGRSRLLGPNSNLPLLEDYLQTDALISPGHSGGPLLDLDGKVVGMNTLITRVERGLAFAVPSNLLQQALTQILAEGRVSHPWLGVRVETLGDHSELRNRLSGASSGAVVLSIEPEGPAFRTDLRPADVIQEIDGVAVQSAMELQRELFAKKVGQSVQLKVWRASGSKVVPVQTMEVPELAAFRPVGAVSVPVKASSGERFGLTLKEVKPRGVRVEGIEPESLAARAELVVGDVITDVEGRSVRTATECLGAIRTALSKGSGGGAILQIERQGRRTFALLKSQ